MEVEHAAETLCLMKHQELDTHTSIILRNLIQTTENQKCPQTRPFPPKRMFPATCKLPHPKLNPRENKNRTDSNNVNKIEDKNKKENEIETRNEERTNQSGNEYNDGVFEPKPDFIEKLNRGEVNLEKPPPVGEAFDGIVLPRFPPIKALQGQISHCSAPFEKQLTKSDMAKGLARFNFCKDQVDVLKKFLTKSEDKQVTDNKEGLDVIVYDRAGRSYEIKLKFWASANMHVLTTRWNVFTDDNELEAHFDWVTVWMFRLKEIDKPCFAIVSRRFPYPNLVGKPQKNANKNKKQKIED